MRPTKKPCCSATILWLTAFTMIFAGCATKPDPNAIGPDGRRCIVGVVDSTDAAILRAKNPAVHAGDFVWTPYCSAQLGDDLLNEVYELTR